MRCDRPYRCEGQRDRCVCGTAMGEVWRAEIVSFSRFTGGRATSGTVDRQDAAGRDSGNFQYLVLAQAVGSLYLDHILCLSAYKSSPER